MTGWRLNLVIIAASLLLTDMVVLLVQWGPFAQMIPNTLLISTISGLIIASLVVSAAGFVRGRIAKAHRRELERGIADATQHLDLALETARVLLWELDVPSGALTFDQRKLAWLGLPAGSRVATLQDWVALLHPDDVAPFERGFQAAFLPGGADFELDYRLRLAGGGWCWVHTRGRAKARNAQGMPVTAVGGSFEITQRKQIENALIASEQRTQALYALLRRVADNVPDMIWAKDTDKRYLFANQAICDQLLMAQDTDEPIGKDDLFFAQRERLSHSDQAHWHTFGELCQDSDVLTLERGCAARFDEFGNVQGQLLYLDVHKAPLIGSDGSVIGVVGSARNVTLQRAMHEKLRISAEILKQSHEGMLLTDADNYIVDVNPAFTRLTGYAFDEVLGQKPRLLRSGKHDASFYQAMWQQINTTGHWQGELWNRTKNGRLFAEWLTINTLYHDDGSVHRRLGWFSDITDKKRAEELIWQQANFDALTQLANRHMFLDRLALELKKAQRASSRLALLFLDLDRFKEVNDSLGHDRGDLLLIEAARRLRACTRESDTVARLGGDEFTVILTDLADTNGIDRIAGDIVACLAQTFVFDDQSASVSVSIGITLYPDDASNLEQLLKTADRAMYSAKACGRNRYCYFQPGQAVR